MDITNLKPFTNDELSKMGLSWHTDLDSTQYISDELISISQQEADAFYEAGNKLYDMYVEAAQYVIDNNLFHELDIPVSLIESIKQSFNEDVHWHIYGRFDFAGGLDGKPIKLLEFNADTPTMLYESSAIQYALLRANGYNDNMQFNNIYEAISENFKRLITLSDDTSNFNEVYEGWRVLFSSIRGSSEEEQTVRFLEDIALNAGLNTDFCFVDEAQISGDGIFFNNNKFEFWFKLIPWENIAIDEPDLALLIDEMMANKETIILNPAYTLLFQSKRMLKILWDLFPNHPLLLETSYTPLPNKKQVKKPAFGREGANVEILGANGMPLRIKNGIYGNHKEVYQEFYELNSHNNYFYQPNIFFAYESCGLGFRKGGDIIDNYSKFVSHIIK